MARVLESDGWPSIVTQRPGGHDETGLGGEVDRPARSGTEPSRCDRPRPHGRAPSESAAERVNATEKMKDRWRRGQRGWPARFPVAQLPNAPLWVALGGWLIAVMNDGSVHTYARATFYVGLAAWAWDELVSGVNWVRRALGAGGLIYVVDKVAAALRA